MVKLLPMAQDDYDSYLEQSIREYAEDHVRNGNWLAGDALEKSRKQFSELLPDGLNTKNEFIYSILDESGRKIGILWVEIGMDDSPRRAFGYDFRIDEEFRGQGFGKQTLAALEELLISMDVVSMGLHVFGDNLSAQALYRKMGFEITGIHMRKMFQKSK